MVEKREVTYFLRQFVTRLTRLTHLDFGFSDRENIADSDFIFGQLCYAQIFTKKAGAEREPVCSPHIGK